MQHLQEYLICLLTFADYQQTCIRLCSRGVLNMVNTLLMQGPMTWAHIAWFWDLLYLRNKTKRPLYIGQGYISVYACVGDCTIPVLTLGCRSLLLLHVTSLNGVLITRFMTWLSHKTGTHVFIQRLGCVHMLGARCEAEFSIQIYRWLLQSWCLVRCPSKTFPISSSECLKFVW